MRIVLHKATGWIRFKKSRRRQGKRHERNPRCEGLYGVGARANVKAARELGQGILVAVWRGGGCDPGHGATVAARVAMRQYRGMPAVLPGLTTSLLMLAGPVSDGATLAEVEALLASPLGQTATQLVRVSRADEFYSNLVRHVGRALREEGALDDRQLACLDELGPDDFAQPLAVTLISHHDPEVLEHALAFYTSPVGARYMRMVYEKNWREHSEDFPLRPDRPKESLTLSQLGQVRAFEQSPLAGPFADPLMVTQWDESRKAAALLWRIQQVKCGIPWDALPSRNPFEPKP